jgi:hypothetical protein
MLVILPDAACSALRLAAMLALVSVTVIVVTCAFAVVAATFAAVTPDTVKL